MTKEQKKQITDEVGKIIIENVRDRSLTHSLQIAQGETKNQLKRRQYSTLNELNDKQTEAVCNLLSETVTDTIYNFLELFEEHNELLRMMVIHEATELDMCQISEKMGSEIAYEEGWIKAFSKIGRFVI